MAQIATLLLAALAFLAVITTAGPVDANGVSLRAEASIDGDHVRLGDLFDGLSPAQAETVIARAPSLGREITLQPSWVRRVARAYGVDYRPRFVGERIVLQRAGSTVPAETIEDALMTALEPHLGEGRVVFSWDRRHSALYVPASGAASVAVADLVHDPVSGQFSALVVAPAEGEPTAQATITGHAQSVVDVPVPTRRMRSGDVIGPDDLVWIEVPSQRIRTDIALAEDELLGMSPRRTLPPDRPVRLSDIREPVVISRGATVQMRYVAGALNITALGRALQDGADGDVIRVVNLDSSRTIEAVVDGPDRVTVLAGAPVPSSFQEAHP